MTQAELHSGLVKKENGVNPFLTVMNYKISYRTWLKAAKVIIEKERIRKESSVSEEQTISE
jgi:hypothetical protein